MKTISSGFKSWKTTLIAAIIAAAMIIESNDLANWKEWIIPALIAALGVFMRDANKTSKASGIAPLIVVGICCAFFVSCADSDYAYDGASLVYIDVESGAKAGLTIKDGLTQGWAKVPIKDKDGNVTGWAKIQAPKLDLIKNQPLPEITPQK